MALHQTYRFRTTCLGEIKIDMYCFKIKVSTKAISTLFTVIATSASAATVGFDCSFLSWASQDGVKQLREPFVLKYISDSSTDKAYLIGNSGTADVTYVANTAGLSFVEVTATGNIMVTAISNAGHAVHSRSVILGTGIVPSQYYGACTKK